MNIKLAILDLNDNTTNLGLGSIVEHVEAFSDTFTYEIFDVRYKNEIPSLDFDIYISSGGPGDPRVGDGIWDVNYHKWIDALVANNLDESKSKKYVFFICHSFQIACIHFNFGELGPRNKKSFGTYPCYLTANGLYEEIFKGLPNPMYIADFRSYEVLGDHYEAKSATFPKILAVEQIDMMDHRDRAIMAVRYSPEMIGTQFHPEAYAAGMYDYFNQPERKAMVVEEHGEERFNQMVRDLAHPNKITLTNGTILPNFLTQSIEKIYREKRPEALAS